MRRPRRRLNVAPSCSSAARSVSSGRAPSTRRMRGAARAPLRRSSCRSSLRSVVRRLRIAVAIRFSSCSSFSVGAMSRIVRSGVVMRRSPRMVVTSCGCRSRVWNFRPAGLARLAFEDRWMVGSTWVGSRPCIAAAGRSLRTACGPATSAPRTRARMPAGRRGRRGTRRATVRLRRSRCSMDRGSTPCATRSSCVTTPRCTNRAITRSTSSASRGDSRAVRGCPSILGPTSDPPETTPRVRGSGRRGPPDPSPECPCADIAANAGGRTPTRGRASHLRYEISARTRRSRPRSPRPRSASGRRARRAPPAPPASPRRCPTSR